MAPNDPMSLMEWKRRIFSLYEEVRDAEDSAAVWHYWRAVRDELFFAHPQSPLPASERDSFDGLPFFDYDPACRVLADVAEAERRTYEIATSGEDPYSFTRFAVASFELGGQACELELYWLDGYGGGLFVPFRDATAGSETYGAGRYVLDTVKGADLGMDGERLVLDFNFAYNPSCAYDPQWVCPLAPPPSRVEMAVRAGERYSAPA